MSEMRRGWIEYERRDCPLCRDKHESCRFAAGSLFCVTEGCGNPHHRNVPQGPDCRGDR